MNIKEEFNLPKLTLEKYLENPTGLKNNSVMRLKDVRDSLDIRYSKLTANKKIKMKVYKYKKDWLFLHFLVPSESYDLNYDVVLRIPVNEIKLKDCEFKAFSNSPSFVYTYAYTFNLRNVLITEFKDKFAKEVLLKEPIQKNYYNIISYEKSIYYAILFLLTHYENVSEIERKADKIKDIDVLKIKLKSDEEKLAEYSRKRKRHQYLKKHDVRVAFADKMKKEKAREEKKLEKLGIKQDKPDYVIKGKEKKTGSSKFKKKISGKSKIKGTVKSKKR